MGCGGTVDYLVDAILNYPTLSEAYKVAALDVTNKIRAVKFTRGHAEDGAPRRNSPRPRSDRRVASISLLPDDGTRHRRR